MDVPSVGCEHGHTCHVSITWLSTCIYIIHIYVLYICIIYTYTHVHKYKCIILCYTHINISTAWIDSYV